MKSYFLMSLYILKIIILIGNNLLILKNQEYETTQELVRKLRHEYQSTRVDAEGMLQVMTGMERQLNDYATKEELITKLQYESREKIEEALLIKEQVRILLLLLLLF